MVPAPIMQVFLRQEVQVMDGLGHKPERIRVVARQFEWSRLEMRFMSTAYERVLPVVRSAAGKATDAGHRSVLGGAERYGEQSQRQAAGA